MVSVATKGSEVEPAAPRLDGETVLYKTIIYDRWEVLWALLIPTAVGACVFCLFAHTWALSGFAALATIGSSISRIRVVEGLWGTVEQEIFGRSLFSIELDDVTDVEITTNRRFNNRRVGAWWNPTISTAVRLDIKGDKFRLLQTGDAHGLYDAIQQARSGRL
ncbi:MAG TPA: hypothetical protein VMS32_09195 [Verrucomicrobiae bacterium]|jgi:hypothetical protein|nr:hypothetical protein [Verrucomicrobiae bacterium]